MTLRNEVLGTVAGKEGQWMDVVVGHLVAASTQEWGKMGRTVKWMDEYGGAVHLVEGQSKL